jgi:alkylhydroperoxidase family enzyme
VVTRVGESHVADGIYRSVRSQFSEKELVDLTLAIIAINGWNRLVVIFPAVPGSYTRDVISTPAKVV